MLKQKLERVCAEVIGKTMDEAQSIIFAEHLGYYCITDDGEACKVSSDRKTGLIGLHVLRTGTGAGIVTGAVPGGTE